MKNLNYKIISSGSKGNALYINHDRFKALIDIGVPYKKINNLKIDYVFLTHEHSDHFNKATVKKFAFEHPKIKWFCSDYMITLLSECKVKLSNIYLFPKLTIDDTYIQRFELKHDVKNYGWLINIDNKLKLMYATDTKDLDSIIARNLDYYFIEANYDEDEIIQRIKEKSEKGEFCYERRVINTHMSKQQADKWIAENAGENSRFVYMHRHKENKNE
jgi:phosphoribosyl 1,2-cyclic phosphodiesterase